MSIMIRTGLDEPDTGQTFVPHRPQRPQKEEGGKAFELVSDYAPGIDIEAAFPQRFKAAGGGWKDGRIYDPESGKTYRSRLRVTPDGSLKVSGCILFVCQSQRWTRAR